MHTSVDQITCLQQKARINEALKWIEASIRRFTRFKGNLGNNPTSLCYFPFQGGWLCRAFALKIYVVSSRPSTA